MQPCFNHPATFDPHQDSFVQEVELLKEESIEDDLLIEGQYLSETDMRECWGFYSRSDSVATKCHRGSLKFLECRSCTWVGALFVLLRPRIAAIKSAAKEDPKRLQRPYPYASL